MPPALSVIIPTWNEAEHLPRTLRALAASETTVEVIVVDADSEDATASLAAAGGAKVLTSERRHRAAQLNLGAGQATGETLLFLHADTLPPTCFGQQIQAALREPSVVGGAFARRFDSPSLALRLTCSLADWRGRCWRVFLGDQAIFVRRVVFERLGGFGLLDQCEDLDFSLRMRRAGQTRLLTPGLISSARRFAAKGASWTTAKDLAIACRYLAGRVTGPSS